MALPPGLLNLGVALGDAIMAARFGCADDAACSARPSLSTMAGRTGMSCVSVTASVFTTAKISSLCRYGCTAPYVPLQYVASGDTLVSACWNTAVPTACATALLTTSSSGDDSSKVSTSTTCSTPGPGAVFSTATPAQQSCDRRDKLAILGGPDTCAALCPDGYTATTSATVAFCTITPTPADTPPPLATSLLATAELISGSSPSPTPAPSPVPSPRPPEPAKTTSNRGGKKVVIVDGVATGHAPSSRSHATLLLAGLLGLTIGLGLL